MKRLTDNETTEELYRLIREEGLERELSEWAKVQRGVKRFAPI